ncbi:MAG TPA: YidC/Oxa1 family membrane protein insertase [Patescibacteria group bacterium]|nr:YidC/Oxa1 family membrane protein insertase [Patescibacteria group bacterium]HLD61905.1 YidC/Oxa1 family membrane protein insertase [Patescibacteria group bacterium]
MSILKMIFYQPLYNGLILIYNFIPGHDLGISIILLTLLIRFVLYPLNNLSIRSQKALQDIQPKIKQVQKEFANNKEQQAKELLKLYKEHKVNPFSSCLPLLIQLPFLIALFSVFKTGITDTAFADLYSFVGRPETINYISFGFLDIAKASPILAIAAAGLQFWQTRMLMHSKVPHPKSDGKDEGKDEAFAATMNKQMMYIAPIMTIVIGWSLPSGLMVYWTVSTIFSIIQQYIVFKRHANEKALAAQS